MANPLGNVCEKLTHMHMVMYTWWCWHIYKGGGVYKGGDVHFGAFGKMNYLFSIASDANSCGWHIGSRVKKIEEKGFRSHCLTVTGR